MTASNPVSRFLQKQRIKRNYAKELRQAEKTAKNTAATAKSAAQKVKDAFKETFLYIKHHSRAVLLVIGIAALITEAEKYIGYPYVWGGSNPNTSFDCSGFVSWVLTQSGVCNTGRLGAQGLYNISTPVSSANARPGDLIFFVGTYDTPGVSHVGIYVGGGKMLHCGDPIQYADINTNYWQSHFYAFGRPPYN